MMVRGAIAAAVGVMLALVTSLSHSPGLKALAWVAVVVVLGLLFITWRPVRQSKP